MSQKILTPHTRKNYFSLVEATRLIAANNPDIKYFVINPKGSKKEGNNY